MILTKGESYLEEFSQGNVIQTVGAVEHHALFGHRLGQILSGLCFTCPSGALRGTTQMQV